MTQATLGYLGDSAARLSISGADPFRLIGWQAEIDAFVPLIEQIIDQIQRRVFNGEPL